MATTSYAQEQDYTENTPDTSLRSQARVDPSTLGMSLQIQLSAYPGRAGNNVPIVLSYSSKVWGINYEETRYNETTGARLYDLLNSAYGQNSVAGWVSSLGIPRISWASEKFSVNGEPGKCGAGTGSPQCYFISRLHVYLADGSSSELREDDLARTSPDQTGTFYAVDNSRLKFETTTNTLWMPDGARYIFSPAVFGEQVASTYIDRNGNTININQSTRQWTDTRGRVISDPLPVAPALGGPFQYSYDPNRPQVGDPTYVVAGVNGTTRTVTFRWRKLAQSLTPDPVTQQVPALRYRGDFKLVFGIPSMPPPHLFVSGGTMRVAVEQELFNPVVLNEIVLPNGSTYKFTYNEYGEIDKIVYPTGGYERFVYGKIPGLRATLFGVYNQGNRGVLNRWVSPTGSFADEQPWVYSASFQSSYYLVTETAPDNMRTERYMHKSPFPIYFDFDDARAGMTFEERTYSAANVLLRRSLTKWAVSGPTPGGHISATRNPRAIKTVNVVLDTGLNPALATATVIRYEQASQPLNPTSLTEYNYQSVDQATAQAGDIDSFNPADSLAIRTTETTYLDSPDYNARNLTSLPTSITTKSGMPSGQVKTRSEMYYDEASYGGSSLALLPCSPGVGWIDPGTLARANTTTTKTWLNSLGAFTDTNAYLATHAQYDQCGNKRKFWDARDTTLTNPAQVEYSSAFQFAYPTLNISPDPDGTGPVTPFISSTEYDDVTGMVTAKVDANTQRTTFGYSDSLNRITQVVRASGDAAAKTQSTFIYDDNAHTVTVTSDLNSYGDNLLKVVKLYDGLGRTSETQTFEGSTNYIATRQEYDELGRAFKSSNPFRPWQNETPSWTTSEFEPLGRVKKVITPDSAVITTDYEGNTATIIDQAGKKRRSVTDGLGRLVRVDEPDANGNLDVSGVPAQSTNYSYDTLDNLTTVTQGEQTRTFVYDSLKRLTSATNPESGRVCYGTVVSDVCQANGYDANGNLVYKTDARGVLSTYAYDALNRNTSEIYTNDPAGTPAVHRYYDGFRDGQNNGIPNSKGRLWQTETSGSAGSRTTVYGYDALGRSLGHTQQFYSHNTWSGYFGTYVTYDRADHVKDLTNSNGSAVYYTYDAAGRTSSVSGTLGIKTLRNYSTAMTYSARGALTKEQFGTDTTIYNKLFYTLRGQLAEIRVSTSSATDTSWERGAIINHYSNDNCWGAACYGADNNGNLRRQEVYIPRLSNPQQSDNFAQFYDYDSLNRLEAARETLNGSATQWQQTFVYDRYGNRTINTGLTSGSGINNREFVVETATNRLYAPGDLALAASSRQMQYDPAGNLKKDIYSVPDIAAATREYDAENRMISETNNGAIASYTYNGDGQRVRRKINDVETWLIYGVNGELLTEYAADSTPYYDYPQVENCYRNGQLLIATGPASGGGAEEEVGEITLEPPSSSPVLEPHWIVADQLGTPRMVIDKTGSLAGVRRHDYLPFGEELSSLGGRTSTMGYVADSVRQKFSQKERDDETGLDFFEARYFSSTQGRFTSTDPLFYQAMMAIDPQRFNLYAYARNNPLKFVDPSGERVYLSGNTDWLRRNVLYEMVGGQEDFDRYFEIVGGQVLARSGVDTSGANAGVQALLGLVAANENYLYYAGTDGNEALGLFDGMNGSGGAVTPLTANQARQQSRAFTGDTPGNSGGYLVGTNGRYSALHPANLANGDPVFAVIAYNTNAVQIQNGVSSATAQGTDIPLPGLQDRVMAIQRAARNQVIRPVSFFIHESEENRFFAPLPAAHRHGFYPSAHRHAGKREAEIREAAHITGGFAGGSVNSTVPRRQ